MAVTIVEPCPWSLLVSGKTYLLKARLDVPGHFHSVYWGGGAGAGWVDGQWAYGQLTVNALDTDNSYLNTMYLLNNFYYYEDGFPEIKQELVSVYLYGITGAASCGEDKCGCEGGDIDEYGENSTHVTPQGGMVTTAGCRVLRAKGFSFNLAVVHRNGDAQDIDSGGRMGLGSHLPLTRRLVALWQAGTYLMIVDNEGRKYLARVYGASPACSMNVLEDADDYWVERTPGGEKYYYEKAELWARNYANVLKAENTNGNAIYYQYDGESRLQSITGGLKALPYFSYNGEDRVSCMALRAAEAPGEDRLYYYEYDASGQMNKVTGPECTHAFAYDAHRRITEQTDAEGYTRYFEYDGAYGGVRKVVEPEGRYTYYEHDAATRTTVRIDARGYATYFQYNQFDANDRVADALGHVSRYEYDRYGNRVLEADALGRASYYGYDGRRNRVYARDPLGHPTYWEYGAYGNVTYQRDALGRASYWSYDERGNRTGAVDPLGGVQYYEHDAEGLLAAARDARGFWSYYTYDVAGNVLSQKDPLGHGSYYTYDCAGNRTSARDALGHVTYSEYDAVDRLTRAADALGNAREYGYDGRGLKTVERNERGYCAYYTYDGVGRLTASKDFGGQVRAFGYDLVGNPTSVTDERGYATYYYYDPVNRQQGVIDALGNETYYVFDAVGNRTAAVDARGFPTYWAYDALNRQSAVTDALGGTSYYAYDAVGNQVSIVNARGYATEQAYDALNRRTAVTDALGSTASSEYDVAGNQTAAVDALGHATYFTYDALNRPQGQVDALGGHTDTVYDAAGNRTVAVDALGRGTYFFYDAANRQQRSMDALGGETYYVYDAAGNATAVFVRLDPSAWAQSQTVYDAQNRQSRTVDPEGSETYYVYDAAGNVVAAFDPLGQASAFAYDALNRPAAAANALGETVYYGYDAAGNRSRLVAPGGEIAYYGYDAVGRLAWVRADAAGVNAVTYYACDAVGNRVRLQDAEGHGTYFGYDALDRLTGEQDSIGKGEWYTYDDVGRVALRQAGTVLWYCYGHQPYGESPYGGQEGDAQVTYYTYDALGRPTRVGFPEGAVAYFAYDAVGNLLSAVGSGEAAVVGYGEQPYGTSGYGGQAGGAAGAASADTFAYDALGRPVEHTVAGVGTVYFAYDLGGRRTLVKDWTGAAAYYSYDRRGLITRVHSPAGWTYYRYDARGAMLSKLLPNAACTYHAYDAAGRLSALRNLKSDGTAISTFEFARDANGNITQSLREDGSCWYYAYDGLQRLTGADWKSSVGATIYGYEYAYDKVGNRLHIVENGTPTYYAYNAANELTVEVTPGKETAYYTYDARGNQTRRSAVGGQTLYFDYNSRNLITRIDSTEPGFTPNTFAYNALGQRIRKTDSTGTTHYVWDGLNITHEHDGAGNVKRRYTHGHTPVPGVFSLIDVEDVVAAAHFFYHLGPLGEVLRLTSGAQAVAKIYEVSPFGGILAEAGAAPNEFLFPANTLALPDLDGHRLGLLRGYLTQTGRWTSRDIMGSLNRYVALRSNPLAFVDPDNAEPQPPGTLGGGPQQWAGTDASLIMRCGRAAHSRISEVLQRLDEMALLDRPIGAICEAEGRQIKEECKAEVALRPDVYAYYSPGRNCLADIKPWSLDFVAGGYLAARAKISGYRGALRKCCCLEVDLCPSATPGFKSAIPVPVLGCGFLSWFSAEPGLINYVFGQGRRAPEPSPEFAPSWFPKLVPVPKPVPVPGWDPSRGREGTQPVPVVVPQIQAPPSWFWVGVGGLFLVILKSLGRAAEAAAGVPLFLPETMRPQYPGRQVT